MVEIKRSRSINSCHDKIEINQWLRSTRNGGSVDLSISHYANSKKGIFAESEFWCCICQYFPRPPFPGLPFIGFMSSLDDDASLLHQFDDCYIIIQ